MGRILIGDKTIMISRGRRKVAERGNRKRVLALIWPLLAAMLLMGLDAHIRSLTTDYRYKTSHSYKEIERLTGKRAELLAEIASLKNPRRIEKIALRMLGLKEPDPERVLVER